MARSLRSRLVIGALLWTLGFFGLLVAVHNEIMRRNPWLPRRLTVAIVPHTPALAALAGVLVVVGVWQVRRGVSGVQRLRTAVNALRKGDERRLDGSFPSEVQPLVDDLNALLEHREQAVARALGRAADLAHGLKTPLALLAREAARAREAGHVELAAALSDEVEKMRRQVEYHLVQARAAASGATPGARCSVLDSAGALARTMERLYAERQLDIGVDVAPDLVFRGQREDLDEMLGNLLDNACKWARSRVTVSGDSDASLVRLRVEDDGPGLAASMCDAVLQRGVRADEAAPGSGLGLAIVRDLADVYAGSITLDRSPLGGVRAMLTLPRA